MKKINLLIMLFLLGIGALHAQWTTTPGPNTNGPAAGSLIMNPDQITTNSTGVQIDLDVDGGNIFLNKDRAIVFGRLTDGEGEYIINSISQTSPSHGLSFFAGYQERMTILNNGNVGIGVVAPTAQLHTTGSVRFEGTTLNNSANRVMVQDNSGNVFWRNGNFGAITNADQGLTVIGGNTAVLGSSCGMDFGLFQEHREVNMNNYNLYFDGGGEVPEIADGKIYMGETSQNPCKQLEARLELSTYLQTNNPINDYSSPQPSTSGLRFTDLTMSSPPVANQSDGVLSLDRDGDVIWVEKEGGGSGNVNSSCITQNLLPKVATGGSTDLICSQIFDNGVSVGIATTGPFSYFLGSPPFAGGGPPLFGTLKLDVNGIGRFTSLYATSDKTLKANITQIPNANSLITQLDGKTYNWTAEYAREANLDAGLHYGFIAQEVEAVMPEAVIKDENGRYGVEYNAFIPVLVESQKELIRENEYLRSEINDLKSDIAMLSQMILKDRADEESPKTQTAKLYQNAPNPFAQKTLIKYFVPECEGVCEVVVYTLLGVEVFRHSISEKGEGEFEFDVSSLPSNQYYVYSLFENGKIVDSKKMLITAMD